MLFYYLVIYPIKQILEIFYLFFEELTRSSGISVIGLSFVVTLCCLPLYIIAESWQEKERILEDSMRPGVKRIKKAFRGDEQFMMLNAFYSQHHYHPIMALRSSFGLLIQIPFFMAAYSFLSHLPNLNGVKFLFIRDMGSPDAMFSIGSFTVNVLPIAMTIINCVSGAIYSYGHKDKREKIQIYVSALVFLVILYNSPAGLVMYWTMNNLLSLVKNVFYKFKNPAKVLYRIALAACICGILVAIFAMQKRKIELRAMLALICIIIAAAPLIIKAVNWLLDNLLTDIDRSPKTRLCIFIFSSLTIALLTGLTIPSILIESEPQEFCYVDKYTSPFIFLRIAFYQGLGFYLFWPICFYALFGKKIKKLLTLMAAFLAVYALVNNFAFTGSYGPLTENLDFMEAQFFSAPLWQIALNALIALIAFAAIVFVLTKKSKVLSPLFIITAFCLTAVSLRNISIVSKAYLNMEKKQTISKIEPVYHLSKTGKNVIVFMQDRLFSPLIDEVFEEKPELVEHFDGFVFYPNTVSFGSLTMVGVPGIFGGYSFTPAEMNKRDTETLQKKHNESILSMPVTFMENGWEATVSDMPYENFGKEPVTDMYKDYPDINRVLTTGLYSDYWYEQNGIEKTNYISESIKHNFIMFSIFKTFPPVLRRLVHHKRWWNANGRKDHFSQFIDNYSCLIYFPEMFDGKAEKSTFTMIDNLSTHEPSRLQYPDYIPVKDVTQTGPSKWAKNAQYNTQAGTLRCYAKFFDWLKENDLYDNTRIIIVSDHGTYIDTGKFEKSDKPPYPKESVTASLIVKDFNDRRPSPDGIHLTKDFSFMTNADTPAIATKDIFPNAKNPFTGLEYDIPNKDEFVKICHPNAESTRNRDHTKLIISNDDWYTVSGDITKNENWKQIFPFGE